MGSLCRAFGIAGTSRGKGAAGLIGKALYLLKTDWQLVRLANKIKPDLLLSFASPYLAHVARMTGIPMVVFDDTEENRIVQKMYSRAAAAIVVPACFGKEINERQFRFQGYFELAYLRPRYFTPDSDIFEELGLPRGERFILLRTVAWQALHDYRHHGLSTMELERLVASFSKLGRIFISAEGDLPVALEPFRLRTPAHRIHEIMAQAALVFSEGATMAAEAAVLAVPAVHCSDLRPGYIDDLSERHGLLRTFAHGDFQQALASGIEFLEAGDPLRHALLKKKELMLAQSIDVVEFMAWLIGQFPDSVEAMRADPGRGQGLTP